MRFFADGPIIPDELLIARDEGSVIFFCGAGVSQARAGLPGFFGLTEKVVADLGAISDGAARRLLDTALAQSPIAGVGGLVPADRIFGLLEREFTVSDVRRSVAKALRSKQTVDLSAHRTLIDLATGTDGRVRLVTTNFDRLFERAAPSVRSSSPPNLPDPRQERSFGGIVHLHGCVTRKYDGAMDDEFVLSSTDFGRAYLSDGWATAFIRNLLRYHQIVFVGYSADDPPVQYLLEALNSGPAGASRLHAFQPGADEEARALWRHKGVEAIPYDDGDNHAALWRTLDCWADRSRDPSGWAERVLDRAMAGPRGLAPFERGQVKQVVSTSRGAKQFALRTPPAEWLGVFDARVRYPEPARERGNKPPFDQFEAFGLDDDPPPVIGSPEDKVRRNVPTGVWHAFEPNSRDRDSDFNLPFSSVRGPPDQRSSAMSRRNELLCGWIADVSHHQFAAWWAGGLGGLHPQVQGAVRRHFAKLAESPMSVSERAWTYLFNAWGNEPDPQSGWFHLLGDIARLGWSNEYIRAWGKLAVPIFTAHRPDGHNSPPLDGVDLVLRQIIAIDIKYEELSDRPDVPTNLLPAFAREHRRVLELAFRLEVETSGYESFTLPPIEAETPAEDHDDFTRSHGISGLFFDFVATLDLLLGSDREAWRREVQSWSETGTLFSRLRIWVAGKVAGFSGADAARLLLELPDDAFWEGGHQRDLLLVLARRWLTMPLGLRRRLERRLLRGPRRWEKLEKPIDYRRRRASYVLTRVKWLLSNGCEFTTDLNVKLEDLKRAAPAWKEGYVDQAVKSLESAAGWVGSDTATRGLEAEPPATLLRRAEKLSGFDLGSFTERQPLAGLAERWPNRLLKALVLAARRGDIPEQAWRAFLGAEKRVGDTHRMMVLIARRLAAIPNEALATIADPVSDWMLRLGDRLQATATDSFALLWNQLTEAVREHPDATRSALGRAQDIKWAEHSLNSPIGNMARTLLRDDNRQPGPQGFPTTWLSRVEQLLALEGDARRDAIVIFAHQLPWLYHWAPEWTEANILVAMGGPNREDRRAFWSGFFWAARIPEVKLFKRIKPTLLTLVTVSNEVETSAEQLSGMILAGWGSKIAETRGRLVSNAEMREALLTGDETFRAHVIWHMATWGEEPDSPWPARTLELLRKVWPKQGSVRSASMSGNLLDLAIRSRKNFREMVAAVTPLMTVVDRKGFSLTRLQREVIEGGDGERDPVALLTLLWNALSENAQDWPYGADFVVEKLGSAAAVANDPRLLQLKLRLAAG